MIKLREFPLLDLFFFARYFARFRTCAVKNFTAKKNYKYTTTAKSLFERLNYTTSWGKLTVKLPSFFLHTSRLLNLNVNKELVTTVGRDSERRE